MVGTFRHDGRDHNEAEGIVIVNGKVPSCYKFMFRQMLKEATTEDKQTFALDFVSHIMQ